MKQNKHIIIQETFTCVIQHYNIEEYQQD